MKHLHDSNHEMKHLCMWNLFSVRHDIVLKIVVVCTTLVVAKIMMSLLCIHTMANGSCAHLSHNIILVLSYQGHSASTLYILDWFHFHYAFHCKSEVIQVKI